MKRLLFAIIILAMSVGVVSSEEFFLYSDQLSADGQFADKNARSLTGDFWIWGFVIETDGTNDTSIEIYDGISTAGHQIYPKFTVSGADNTGGIIFPRPIPVKNGIYGDITTTGGAVQVYYNKK